MNDYHVHCSLSPDCNVDIDDMIQEGIKLGLKEIAFTDHFNPAYPNKRFLTPLPSEEGFKLLCDCQEKYKGQIRIVKGIENGVLHNTIEDNKMAASMYDYDFVMGSFHSMAGIELNDKKFFEGRSVEDTYVFFYNYTLDCFRQYKDYDVIGHINVLDRYAPYVADEALYMDIIKEIFSMIISEGKGIEINTSSLRYGMKGRSLPTMSMLKLYKELGGEIITIGSDAHTVDSLADGLTWGYELLRAAGFKYTATYKNRKPYFETV